VLLDSISEISLYIYIYIYVNTICIMLCIIYWKNLNNNDMENLQINVNKLGEWVFENEMIINPTKSKVVCFTKALVTEPLNYSLRDIIILEASSCKYLRINILPAISLKFLKSCS
jgi:hypothetical protein